MKKTIQKVISALLLAIMLMGVIPAFIAPDLGIKTSAAGYSGYCGDNLQWSLNTSTYTLTISGTGAMYDYEYLDLVPWYSYRSYIFSIIIGDNVTSIGIQAFASCSRLTSVTIGNSVTTIGSMAFSNCERLKSIKIPDSVTSIGSYAFILCTSLSSITIGYGLTSVSTGAFTQCSNLQHVYYALSQSKWKSIYIDHSHDNAFLIGGNIALTNAEIHYNCHTHSYTSKVTDKATCTESGLRTYMCACGDSYTETISPLGHDSGKWVVTKQPTLTDTGTRDLCCTACGEILKTEVIPKLNPTVKSVKINDIKLTYKKSNKITPDIFSDPGAKYTVSYSSSNSTIVSVDENGNIQGLKKGTVTITVKVTDNYGNTVTDTCTVTVKLTFGQILIKIFLFGWIWY
ncbi:MAG: leucine-rich repeat protein [Clostridiales bacterium]|nr:leucine-rich repeat protein [Clostridiales bacterium]